MNFFTFVALAISFEQPSYTVTEGTDTQVRVCVQLTGQLDPSSDVDITVSSLSDTATGEFLLHLKF